MYGWIVFIVLVIMFMMLWMKRVERFTLGSYDPNMYRSEIVRTP